MDRFESDQTRTTVPFRHFNTTDGEKAVCIARNDMAEKLKAFNEIFDRTSNQTLDNTNERASSR